ncbi:MAG: YCF48-related protein [Candidatus Korobacteraceae bacterium]
MKSLKISSAANYVKSVVIATALLGCLVVWAATTASGQTGWAVGNAPRAKGKISGNGVILYYSKGNWTAQDSGVKADLKAVASFDGKSAVAVGTDGTLLYFDPKEQKWVDLTCACTDSIFRSVYFADAKHAWIVGSNNTILYSDDGGENWNPQTEPDPNIDLYGVKFVDAQHGWAVGSNKKAPIFLWWDNANKKWQQANNLFRGSKGIARGVDFIKTGKTYTGWVVGDGGLGIWKGNTDEDGQPLNWQLILRAAHPLAVQAINQDVWVAGLQPWGRNVEVIKPFPSNLLNSTNGGGRWLPKQTKGYGDLRGLAFFPATKDAQRGWVVGNPFSDATSGAIWSTANGNSNQPTWTQYQFNDKIPRLNGITMVQSQKGGVKLDGSTSPESATAGENYVSVTGSGYPEGNITPSNLVVDIALRCHGATSASTSAVSVVSASSDSNLISFLLPGELAPGQYFISISDSEEGDANFESSNCSTVNVAQ